MSLGIDAQTHAATSKTTPVDTDEVPIVDSASSFSLKKLTWGNIKATLLSSPALTGTPTAPTASAGTNNTQLANTAYVDGKMILRTSVLTISGTSFDFTGIPSWVKRITVMFNGVSTNGTSNYLIQIGLNSVTTSTYVCSYGYFGNSNTSSSTNTTSGFGIYNTLPGNIFYGHMLITLVSGNIYIATSTLGNASSSNCYLGGGSVSISGSLDRIRLTTVNGTDTFDGGSINIMYEG
jgi:hypothetical protein